MKKKVVKKKVVIRAAQPKKPVVTYADLFPHVNAITMFVGEGRARRPRW